MRRKDLLSDKTKGRLAPRKVTKARTAHLEVPTLRKPAVMKKARVAGMISARASFAPKFSELKSYRPTQEGVLVPEKYVSVVPPGKLTAGFSKAKKEINRLVQNIIDTMKGEYIISEIELTASFNADGKFMGFGVGGAASITIKIAPKPS